MKLNRVYQFPVTAVKNKSQSQTSGLEHRNLFSCSFGVQKSEIKVLQGPPHSRGQNIPYIFQLLVTISIPLLIAVSSPQSLPSFHISSVYVSPLCIPYKDTCYPSGWSRMISSSQICTFITSEVTFMGSGELGIDLFLQSTAQRT